MRFPALLVSGLLMFIVLLAVLAFATLSSNEWVLSSEISAKGTWGFALYGQPVAQLIGEAGFKILGFGALSLLFVLFVSCFYGYFMALQRLESLSHKIMQGFIDVLGTIPSPLLAGVVLYAYESSLWGLSFAFALAAFDSLARFSWSLAKGALSQEHYHAALGLGASNLRIFFTSFIFDWFGPASAKFCNLIVGYVLFGTAAVIIGLLDESAFGWGALVQQGRQYFDLAPHLIYWGWGVVFWTSLTFGMISSGIQLLFDRKNLS